MAQILSNLRHRRAGNHPSASSSCNRSMAGRRRWRSSVAAAIIAVCWTPAAFGDNGPGLGFKIGAQTFDHPVSQNKTTRTRYELELSSQMFLEDHLDFALTIGGSSLGSYDSVEEGFIDETYFEEYYTDDLSLIDVRLAARLYPLGDSAPIRPYIGAGIGYFWLLDSWDGDYYDTVEDPDYPGTYITFFSEDEDTETLAEGLFPFILGGVTVPVGSDFEFLFEFQLDIEKEDSGIDLGGPIYMFGARFRF